MSTGAVILDQARSFMARYCTFPNQASLDLAVLFAAHTHAVDQNDRLIFDASPRLMFSSEGPGSGKSRALELTQVLCHNGQIVNDPTAPSFAQSASEQRATILVDEMDCLLGKGTNKQDLRSLFNASYKRKTAFWSRAGKPPVPIFAAVAFAGMGEVFRTAPVLAALRSRTIVIQMVPATPPEPYRPRIADPVSDALRADLTEWVGRNTSRIMDCWPDMPEGITEGRAAELAEPLIQVADIAGGHWGESARNAVRQLLLGQSDKPDTLPLTDQLLLSLRTVFADREQLGSVDAVEGLYALDPKWGKLWPSEQTATRELAALLSPLGIETVRRRVDGVQMRAYDRDALMPFWSDLDDALLTDEVDHVGTISS